MSMELNEKINKLYYESELLSDFNGYILIKEGNQILFQQNFGYSNYDTKAIANENTIYNIGSITKQFIALSVLQLAQRGSLSIDHYINEYLTDFVHGSNIKIRYILNMVSGIPEYWNKAEWQETQEKTSDDCYSFIKSLLDYQPPFQNFEYHNSNYIVLGKLIEKVSGLTLSQYLKDNIFDPIGMERTYFLTFDKDRGNYAEGYKSPRVSKWERAAFPIYSYAGAGGIYSTATDLCKWDNALYTEKLLNDMFLHEMFRPVKSNYAMGWFIDGLKASHGGDAPGFSTRITRDTQRKILIILLCNTEGCKDSNMCHYADIIDQCIYEIKDWRQPDLAHSSNLKSS